MRNPSVRGSAALILPLILFCLVSPRSAAAQQCEHEAQRSETVSMAGIERVDIDAGAGDLRVEGRPGLAETRVRGHACASDAGRLADLGIRTTRRGSTLHVEALYPENRMSIGNDYAYLHMSVELPEGIAVRVDDGSGNSTVIGTGALQLHDGSGNLEVRDIRGSVRIVDGSGNIELERVAGSAEIEDGSGNIDVVEILGSLEIEDGSGEIDIAGVRDDVDIDDGSGSVRVREVGGDLDVDDGSGTVRHSGVRGSVSIDD